jgi:hypothetical protein
MLDGATTMPNPPATSRASQSPHIQNRLALTERGTIIGIQSGFERGLWKSLSLKSALITNMDLKPNVENQTTMG